MSRAAERNNYPLYAHARDELVLPNGKPLDALSKETPSGDESGAGALGVHATTLERQADIAAAAGFLPLAANLRRAAEMTRIPDEEILRFYDALRPGRMDAEGLERLADKIEAEYAAPLTAALVREAAEKGV